MHLHVEVFYPNMSLDECYRLHRDERYQKSVARHANTQRDLMVYEPLVGGGLRRVAAFTYRRSVEGGLSALLHELTPQVRHLEESTYFGPSGGAWSIVGGVAMMPNCVRGAGTLTFGQEAGGVRRIVDGDLSCTIWGIKSIVEPQIVRKTAESLLAAATYTPHYVHKHGFPGYLHGVATGARLGAAPL